jgi:chromosome segregation ATPase
MPSFRAAVVTIPHPPTRARSVDRAYRIPDPVDTTRKETSSLRKPPTNRPRNPQSIQIAAENNELLKQLQETVCSLKEESIKTTEECENKMRDYSDIKSQLEKSKSNELELAKTLQRVLTDVESQQSVTSQELSIVYKLRESETNLLEEKFNGVLCDRDEAEKKLYNKMQEVERMWMDKVTELENELQTYESVHHEFNSLKSMMSEKMRDVDRENRRLHEENKSTKAEAEKAVALAKEEAQARVKCLTQKMDEIDTKNSELDLSLAEANISKVNMELDLNNIKADLENQSRILATTEEKRLQQITQIEDLTKSNAQMKEEIHILNEKLQDRNEQIAERNQEMKVLQLKLEQAQSQSDAKENKLLALDAKLDFKLAKAGQEIEALQTQIQERDKLLMEMKQTTESSKMKVQIAEGEIECRDKKMNEYSSEVKHLRMTVQQSDKEVNVLKMKVQEKDKQLNDQNVTIENLQTMVEGLNSNVKRYEKKIPEYEAQLSRLKADLGEYKTKTSITEKEVLSLQSELVSVNKRRESSEKVASVAQEQESKLKGTIQGLRSELQMATQNLEKTESKLATVRAEGDARKCQLKTALQSLDEMMAYITSMRDENDEVVTSLEGDLEKALLAKQELKKRYVIRIHNALLDFCTLLITYKRFLPT